MHTAVFLPIVMSTDEGANSNKLTNKYIQRWSMALVVVQPDAQSK